MANYDKQYRDVISDALDFLKRKEKEWNLKVPIDQDFYIQDIISHIEGNKLKYIVARRSGYVHCWMNYVVMAVNTEKIVTATVDKELAFQIRDMLNAESDKESDKTDV